jgi:hypothetical protein
VVYLEWRNSGPEGEISRQRIWAFRMEDRGEVRMDFYAFKAPDRFAGAPPAAFAALTQEDLIGYGPACALRVTPTGDTTFDAGIRPEECRIIAQSGREMGIGARVTLMSTGLLYSEEGLLADGGYAFKVPGGPPYEFRKR